MFDSIGESKFSKDKSPIIPSGPSKLSNSSYNLNFISGSSPSFIFFF